jgi:hypothetical protein
MTDPGLTPGLEPSAIAEQSLDWRLFLVVSLILIAITALFVVGLFVQWQGYNAGLQVALTPPVDHGAALSYSRGLDAAIVKSSALFLGYLLVFTGALYVLRSSTAAYQLSLKTGNQAGTLQTTSPGLVIITLGVLLIVVTILTKSKLDYVPPAPQQQQEQRPPEKAQPIARDPSLSGPAPHKAQK